MNRNLYHVDGVLLGAGAFTAFWALLFSVGIAHEINDSGASFGLLVALLLVVGCPLAMLITGWRVRRYEKTLVEMWQLIVRNNNVGIEHLCDVFSMDRKQVGNAVRRINRRGSAFLVADTEGDVVRNGQQLETMAHSQECAECGASVAVEVRAAGSHYNCPYCGAGLNSEDINSLRRQMHDRESASSRNQQTFFEPAEVASGRRFNLVVFIILVIIFWPAAIGYAIWVNAS